MPIQRLQYEHFRNLAAGQLEFHPRLNLIHGSNGSGKTALLEALYSLGRGKSFRETQTRHIIAYGESYYRLVAEIETNGRQQRLGMERSVRGYILRCNGETLHSLGRLAEILPIQILNSDHFALIDQGPEYRRRFTDYGLFFHDSAFLPAWQRYAHALRSRNAALRQNWPDDHIRPYHTVLADSAAAIDAQRRRYLTVLEDAINRYHAELGGLESIAIRYYKGWAEEAPLADLLDKRLNRDRQLKHTRDGIHRAEWRFYADGQDTAHHFSRGQQKTLLCALLLAQSQTIAADTGVHPVMLIDDIAAELDAKRRALLMEFLQNSGSQLFITAIEPDAAPADSRRFYIEQGILTTV